MAKPVWTAERTGRALVKSLLPVRSRLAHKGDFGKVLLLCGSKGLAGAAMLAARAGGNLFDLRRRVRERGRVSACL